MFTDDRELAVQMDSIRLHGKAPDGDKYDIARVGVNGRLDTLQAAILIEKMSIFAEEISLRQDVARRYTQGLAGVTVTPHVPAGAVSVWAQYTIRVPSQHRAAIMADLKAQGIPTAVYYPRPLHQQAAYCDFPTAGTGLATSERLSDEVLSLPMHPYLDTGSQDRIIEALRESLARY